MLVFALDVSNGSTWFLAGLGTTLVVVALLLPTVLLMSRSLQKQSRRVR
jgi:hypothetical protein